MYYFIILRVDDEELVWIKLMGVRGRLIQLPTTEPRPILRSNTNSTPVPLRNHLPKPIHRFILAFIGPIDYWRERHNFINTIVQRRHERRRPTKARPHNGHKLRLDRKRLLGPN